MWFTCYICHKTYTMKCNLRRHLNSTHMDKTFNCNYCAKGFKRNDYLKRHIFKKHHNKDVFSRIHDCISTESSPEIKKNKAHPTVESPGYDSVDDFLETILTEGSPPPSYTETSTTICCYNAASVDTNSIYSGATSTDAFLESLVTMDPSPTSFSPEPSGVIDPSTSFNADPVTTHCSSQQSLATSVTQGSQTDICTLAPTKLLVHSGTNTTPRLSRDKCLQISTSTNEVYTSPHAVQMDFHPLQGWDSPVTSSPKTPEADIPRYYTSAYQSRRRELNLPEGITYQGPLTKDDEENPLPPHLNNSPAAWGNTPKQCESPQFQLIDYLEDMCTHITPPI